MTRILAALLALATVAGSAAAAEPARNDELLRKPSGRVASTMNLSAPAAVASATYARVALVFDYQYGILRSKGVSAVRKPSGTTGLYCVAVSAVSSSVVPTLVPQVTVDYSGSSGAALAAYARTSTTSCRSNEIAVQTMRGDTGRFLASSYVGFTLVAP